MVRPAPTPTHTAVEPVADDAPIALRFLEPSEAAALTDAIVRSYGDSYDCRWVYDTDEVARRLTDGTLKSLVATERSGRIVGHLGLTRTSPDAIVGEAGQAVVDPAYRGHHLFESLKRTLATWCRANGVVGMYSEATAAHPYSQKANLALGAKETGFLLGYIPATVSYVGIDKQAPARQSAALFFLETNAAPSRLVHPPSWHVGIIGRIHDHLGLERTIVTTAPDLAGRTKCRVDVRDDHQEAFITIDEMGADILDVLDACTKSLLERTDCIYLDLALRDPVTAALPYGVHTELGYFFGGIVPELTDGDVLRLQHLAVPADPSDVAVASEFGAELLAYVFERKSDTSPTPAATSERSEMSGQRSS